MQEISSYPADASARARIKQSIEVACAGPVSEIEREGLRLADELSKLSQVINELAERLQPVSAIPAPECKEDNKAREVCLCAVGETFAAAHLRAEEMTRRIRSITSRLCV